MMSVKASWRLPDGRELLARVDQALAARLSDPEEFISPRFDGVLAIEPPDEARLRAESTAR
jgi:hypothetical protein